MDELMAMLYYPWQIKAEVLHLKTTNYQNSGLKMSSQVLEQNQHCHKISATNNVFFKNLLMRETWIHFASEGNVGKLIPEWRNSVKN